MTLISLHSDIIHEIASYLDDPSIVATRFVCHRLHDVLKNPPHAGVQFCPLAAEAGYLNLLKWATEEGAPNDARLVPHRAAKGGHLEVLQWINSGTLFYHSSITSGAAEGGLRVLQWVVTEGRWRNQPKWHLNTCAIAAGKGDLPMLKWVKERGAPWSNDVTYEAAKEGHLEVLMWAIDNGAGWHPKVCAIAAEKGHLEVLQWARSNGALWDDRVVGRQAIMNGHLHVLQWMHDFSIPLPSDLSLLAAQFQRIKILEWAKQKGYAIDSEVCKAAARNGNLEILQWAQKNGIDWHPDTCMEAAQHHHIEILKWARVNGAPDDARVFTSNYVDVLWWALGNGLPIREKVISGLVRKKMPADVIAWHQANGTMANKLL